MITLGFNGFGRGRDTYARLYDRTGRDRYRVLGHDAAAALFVDGRLVAAAEEERFLRDKKTSAFPRFAAEFCLREAGLSARVVDTFVFPWDFSEAVVGRVIRETMDAKPRPCDQLRSLARFAELYGTVLSPDAVIADLRAHLGADIPADKVVFVPHHVAHLMCGFFLAGFPHAAFLVTDGRGEVESSILGEIDREKMSLYEESSIGVRDSLGLLYASITRYLGYVANNDEYKVMGLSAYASPEAENPLLTGVIRLGEQGTYSLRHPERFATDAAAEAFFDEIFERERDEAKRDAFALRVAWAIQDATEKVCAHQVRYLAEKSGADTLLIDGGVALNCVSNTKVLEASRFTDAHVSFGASDPGVAIGAGFYPSFVQRDFVPHEGTPYLGPQFSEHDVEAALTRAQDGSLTVTRMEPARLLRATARLLRQRVVIGWFQGRMEFGPRALGNRSILANPAFPDIQDVINRRVKKREPFRPFAPVVLEHRAAELFDLGKKTTSPYMTFVFPVLPGWRDRVRGAVHVDGTGRMQTVSAAQNARLAGLLEAFAEETGVPCLINTSFNVAGEPIVCTPDDAIRCFMSTEIDYLVLGDCLVAKPEGAALVRDV